MIIFYELYVCFVTRRCYFRGMSCKFVFRAPRRAAPRKAKAKCIGRSSGAAHRSRGRVSVLFTERAARESPPHRRAPPAARIHAYTKPHVNIHIGISNFIRMLNFWLHSIGLTPQMCVNKIFRPAHIFKFTLLEAFRSNALNTKLF